MKPSPKEPTAGHTPGPWTSEKMLNPPNSKDRRCGFVVNGPENGEPLPDRICDLRVPPGMRFREYRANARLIAAAPELVEALTGLLQWSQECFPSYATDDTPVISNARTLLTRLNAK